MHPISQGSSQQQKEREESANMFNLSKRHPKYNTLQKILSVSSKVAVSAKVLHSYHPSTHFQYPPLPA